MMNASILEQVVRKASRERAPFVAETLRIACLNSAFPDVCASRAVFSQCCRGLSAQQHNSLANQTAGRWVVRNLSISENPPRPFQALPSKTRSAARFLWALILVAPMGAAHPFWGKNGKQEARSPAGARCRRSAEGLGLEDCKSSGARELR